LRSSGLLTKSGFHIYRSDKNLEDSDPKVEIPKPRVIHHNKTASANPAVQYDIAMNMQHRNCNSMSSKNQQSNLYSNVIYDHNKGSEETEPEKSKTPEDLTFKEDLYNLPQSENTLIKNTDKNEYQESSYIDATEKIYKT